ncbi:MAG: Asp-tRNA(Asn)/Glu-tRNA(Gln) amidotransferase subunit GatB [Candidatus Vogelbacteria bacterium]|nr:Asp-tRNA(Asn)/Glu-tRNA(Gln) amidotransferase subunit GatB [Candidatus Vogelbacteria bacterium]
MTYQPVIGLEIHAQLQTRTKMFCNSVNDPDEKRPNVNICPICLGHPGTLPTINKKAVEHVLRLGLAVGGQLADRTEFDRKNYFYPDLPKGYQISQYRLPLVTGGELAGVALTRVHLEEDTARLIHDHKNGGSLIDFNRAGVPLMELVTEPMIKSAKEAGDFARELQLLLRYLDVSRANMEKGELRVEANVSVKRSSISRFDLKDPSPKVEPLGTTLGIKVEIKNLNSFRVVERAIDYELKRQTELLERGEKVVQETRGWDEKKGITFSQREKESAHDYRYFPDPDLPPLRFKEIPEWQNLAATIPELPWQKRARYEREFGLRKEALEIISAERRFYTFFDQVAKQLVKPELVGLAANYLLSDLAGLGSVWPAADHFVELIQMIGVNEISSRAAKDILTTGLKTSPRQAAAKRELLQQSDETVLRDLVNQAISKNPKVVADYQNGKKASLQFLVGQGMKLSRGRANPQVLARLFEEILA